VRYFNELAQKKGRKMSGSQQVGATPDPTLADHANKLKSLTEELRLHPERLERVLGDIDHVASAIASVASIAG